MQKVYKITKLGKVKNPRHKDSTYGESKPYHLGFYTKEPTIGERFELYAINSENRGISTSRVTKIIDSTTFETLNSIYQIEEIKTL